MIVDATQWFQNGDHPLDKCNFIASSVDGQSFKSEGNVVRYFRHPNVPEDKKCEHCGFIMHAHGWIDTLEGGHTVCPGDFIITGVQGEHYPCKPEIFVETYETLEGKTVEVRAGAGLQDGA